MIGYANVIFVVLTWLALSWATGDRSEGSLHTIFLVWILVEVGKIQSALKDKA